MDLSSLILAVGDIAENAQRLHDAMREGRRIDTDTVIEELVRNQTHLAHHVYILASTLQAARIPR